MLFDPCVVGGLCVVRSVCCWIYVLVCSVVVMKIYSGVC